MFGADIGIDLGTTSIIIYTKGRGIVLNEPTVVAVDRVTGAVVALGKDASRILGRTPRNIKAVRPLEDGVISNFSLTEQILQHFIQKAIGGRRVNKPRVAICIPSEVTAVEKKAVIDAAKSAGARKVFIIEEPVAAAIGSGIDISRACGSMVVDVGGGTTDIAVISLGGSVASTSLKVGGNHFDNAIIKYLRNSHNLLVGEKTAEDLKINIGTAYEHTLPVAAEAKGRDLISGLPKSVLVQSSEMYRALRESVQTIVAGVCGILEETPPELAGDICERGIVLTGGGAMLNGLDKLIEEETHINTMVAENAELCVAIGTGKYIEYASSKQMKDLVEKGLI